jgi:hypothetical protein
VAQRPFDVVDFGPVGPSPDVELRPRPGVLDVHDMRLRLARYANADSIVLVCKTAEVRGRNDVGALDDRVLRVLHRLVFWDSNVAVARLPTMLPDAPDGAHTASPIAGVCCLHFDLWAFSPSM